MSFVVIATWIAKPGQERNVAAVIKEMIKPSRAESGNLTYLAHVSSDDPQTFLLYEEYDSPASYDAHRASSHFRKWVGIEVIRFLASRQVSTFWTI